MRRRFGGALRKTLAALLAGELLLGSAAPAAAQRRRGEPEANPQFQQQLQSGAGARGGPIAEAGPIDDEPAAPLDDGPVAPRSVQAVQIGTTQPRPAAAAPTNPLDSRVTVRVKGAPLATFLDTISAQARVNFIITEGLEAKRVTAFLQNVTVREALQVLLEIKGLTYQQIGKSNTYVVMERSKKADNMITRIYTLNYVPLIPLGTAGSERAAISPQTSGGGTGGGAGGGLAALTAGAAAAGASGASGAQGASNETIAILDIIQSVLTQGGAGDGQSLARGGQVRVEPRTNSLIVTDIPEVFPQVEQIISELDRKAPQVMIEAQIVEIDSNRTKDLGIEWGGSRGELGSFTAGRRDTSFPQQLPANLSKMRFLDPIDPTIGVISRLAQGQNSVDEGSFVRGSFLEASLLDLTALRVTLRALVARAEARFLGKPKILTLNNKPAIIQVATNQALSVQQQLSSGGGAVATAGQQVERAETGLILSVTPQVNKEGYITMLVQPSFTDVREASVSNANSRIFDPISRAASTLVRVKNGQTLVLGGLLQSTESKVVRKVPLLGYIPVIGWLFTSTSSTRRNSDLVIFITPTIVSD